MSSPATPVIPHALLLLVPLFAVVLVPQARNLVRSSPSPSRNTTGGAYAFIALLVLLSTLAGALPLVPDTPPVAVAVVQALLSFFSLPALQLASRPPYAPRNINSVLQLTHTVILVISLLGATLSALVLPSSAQSYSPQYLPRIPPALFLLYSVLALLRLLSALFSFSSHLFSQRKGRGRGPSISSSSSFFSRKRNRSSTARRPITIHIETQRTSIPLSLSSSSQSQTSSSEFCPENVFSYQKQRELERPIELEVAFPKKLKDTRSRPTSDAVNLVCDTDGRYLDSNQDEKEKEKRTALLTLVVKPPHPLPNILLPQQCTKKNLKKHETSDSVDSTSSGSSSVSTITGVEQKSATVGATVPVVSVSLETPNHAIHHQHRHLNFTSSPHVNFDLDPPPFSSAHQDLKDQTECNDDDDEQHQPKGSHYTHWQSKKATRRTRTVLLLLFAAQLILVVGYACACASASAARVNVSRPSSSSSSSSRYNNITDTALVVSLKIVQSITTVLAIGGTMSTYLLHAYNTHISPSRRSRASGTTTTTAATQQYQQPPPPPPSAYKSHANTITTQKFSTITPSSAVRPPPPPSSSSFSYANPTSAKSASALFSQDDGYGAGYPRNGGYDEYYPHQHQSQQHHQHQHHQYQHDHNYSHNPHPTVPSSAVSMHHQSHIQVAEDIRDRGRPVVIQLAAPPPPRSRMGARRKLFDGGIFGDAGERESGDAPTPAMAIVAKEREREREREREQREREQREMMGMEMERDVARSVSISSYAYPPSSSYPHAAYNNNNHSSMYDGGTSNVRAQYHYDHNANGASDIYTRPQPIILTYEPPVISGGMSLLETTETEGEDGDLDLDLDLDSDEEVDDSDEHEVEDREGTRNNSTSMDMDMDMGMNVDDMDGDEELDLEGEMQKALSLSRESSMASSASGSGDVKTKTKANSNSHSHSHNNANNNNNLSQPFLKSKPKSKAKAKPKAKPKSKKPAEDPATYIRKRGSMPAAPRVRKLFGWEFGGWDRDRDRDASVGGGVNQNNKRGSVNGKKGGWTKDKEIEEREREREAQEASFMDFKGRAVGSGGGNGNGMAVVGKRASMSVPPRKLKRHSTPAGSLYRSLVGGGGAVNDVKEREREQELEEKERERERQEQWNEILSSSSGPVLSAAQASVISMNLESKKLKKMRSESASLRPSVAGITSAAPLSARGFVTASSSSGSTFNGNNGNSRKLSRSGSSTARPGTGDSSSRASLNHNGRGLQLKRSFKLSVGRTLGPGLTLASASIVGNAKDDGEEAKKSEDENYGRRPSDDRPSSMGDDDELEDVDVDGEIRSISAARLVSASIARVTPAATIVTAPLTTAPIPHSPSSSNPTLNQNKLTLVSNVPQRPVLHAIVTSAPIPIPSPNAVPFPMSAPASRRPPTGLSPVALSPTSARQPPHTSGSNWKPHPFADLVEPSPATVSSNYTTGTSSEGMPASIEDDVVLLEREIMEGIRGRRGGDGNNKLMESPTIQFRELEAAMGVQGVSGSSPSTTLVLSSSMTPSLNSMFAHAHAQAQTVGPPPPSSSDPAVVLTAAAATTTATPIITEASEAPTSGTTSEKTKNKIFGSGGQPQKRIALSSPPASKSDWGPQSSAGPTTPGGGGFPYRFPMIFPHSFTGSPPRPGVQVNGQGGIAPPRPGTPRGGGGGGSTLRLSAMTMTTVRNTFAGLGARMSSATSRMSVNSTVGGFKVGNGNAFGEMVMEDTYGDFMDLRDPFASPPPTSTVAFIPPPPPPPVMASPRRKGSRSKAGAILGNEALDSIDSGYGGADVRQVHDATRTRKKMSSWGKLPVPAVRSFSPAPSAGSGGGGNGSTTGSKRHSFIISGRIVGKPVSAVVNRKHKKDREKEKRTRKTTLPSNMAGVMMKPGAEDADFGLEEALLSQRLLNRLVSDGWESRM